MGSDTAIRTGKCTRCGTAIESCAFCDEPDCAAMTCHRCVKIALLEHHLAAQAASVTAAPGGAGQGAAKPLA